MAVLWRENKEQPQDPKFDLTWAIFKQHLTSCFHNFFYDAMIVASLARLVESDSVSSAEEGSNKKRINNGCCQKGLKVEKYNKEKNLPLFRERVSSAQRRTRKAVS